MRTFKEIVSARFGIPETDIRDDLSGKDVPEWDSMNYLLFIAELEKEFGFSFTMDEVLNAQTLGDLRAVVEARKQ
jgi:acyl carrier protein